MLTKAQAKSEREQIKHLTAQQGKLSDAGKSELIRLKCRNELISFMIVMSGKVFMPYQVHELVVNFVQKAADDYDSHEYLTVSLPPRTGKSMIISKYLPAFQLGRNPRSQHILASHTLSLTDENMGKVIEIINNPNFKKIFPECKLSDRGITTRKFRTKAGGGCLAATPQTKVSGFDAGTMEHEHFPGLIILDDLLADGDSVAELETAWNFVSVQLFTRGLPNKAFISMGTRYHAADVTGRLLEADPDLWKTLNVPALCMDPSNDPLGRQVGESHWPEKFAADRLRITQRIQGDEQFNTVYQGMPKGSKGNYILEDDFVYVEDRLPGYTFFSVDTSLAGKQTSDYNAVCVWQRSSTNNKVIQLVDILNVK